MWPTTSRKHSMLYHIIAYHTIPNIPYHSIPYHTISYDTIPYHTIPYHTVSYHSMPYITIPYRTASHYTIRASPCENLSSGKLGQRRPRSASDPCIWSEPSLSAYRIIGLQNVWMESTCPDDTLRMCRMIWICTLRACLTALFRLMKPKPYLQCDVPNGA